jgi:2-oxoglutarate ferredoxin oxidoreductase subunit gamma
MDNIGKPIVFNICMLGAVIALTKLIEPESVIKVLATRIPKEFIKMNQQALNLGIALGEKIKR